MIILQNPFDMVAVVAYDCVSQGNGNTNGSGIMELFKWMRTGKTANMRRKTFEVWVKTEVRGTFVTQTMARIVTTVYCFTQEEADAEAKRLGGYAVAATR